MGRWKWLVVAWPLVACGSRGPIFDDPFRGRDGGSLPDAPGPDAAPPCEWTPLSEGLAGGGLGVVTVDPADASRRTLAAASGQLVYWSDDGGDSWLRRGEVPGEIRALAFASTGLLASSSEGLFASSDGGATFVPHALDGLSVGALSMRAAGSQGYVTVVGLGVLRTNDGGRTWASATRGLEGVIVHRLDVDPRDADVAIATTIVPDPVTGANVGNGQLARTVDGGASWQIVEDVGGSSYDLRRCAHDADVILAVRRYGMFVSRDGGATFATLPAVGEQVFFSGDVGGEACDRVVAFSGFPTAGFGIYSGTVDAPLEGPFLEGFEMSRSARSHPEILQLDAMHTLAATVSGPFSSGDGGRTFRSVEGFLNLPPTLLEETGGALWLGTYGSGLWTLAPDATRWARVSASSLDNDYTFGLLPRSGATADGGEVIVGLYGPLVARRDGEERFTSVSNDGGPADNVFDFTELPDGTILAASQTEGVQRSEDGGATFRFSNDGIVPWSTALGVLADMRAIETDPSRPGLVVAGGVGGGVWRSTDGGRSWSQTGLEGEDVRPIAVAPDGRFFAVVHGDGVFASDDGSGWTPMNDGLDSLDVDGLTVAPDGALFATAGGATYVHASTAARWSLVGGVCAPTDARFPRVVTRDDGEWLVVVTGGRGLSRRRL